MTAPIVIAIILVVVLMLKPGRLSGVAFLKNTEDQMKPQEAQMLYPTGSYEDNCNTLLERSEPPGLSENLKLIYSPPSGQVALAYSTIGLTQQPSEVRVKRPMSDRQLLTQDDATTSALSGNSQPWAKFTADNRQEILAYSARSDPYNINSQHLLRIKQGGPDGIVLTNDDYTYDIPLTASWSNFNVVAGGGASPKIVWSVSESGPHIINLLDSGADHLFTNADPVVQIPTFDRIPGKLKITTNCFIVTSKLSSTVLMATETQVLDLGPDCRYDPNDLSQLITPLVDVYGLEPNDAITEDGKWYVYSTGPIGTVMPNYIDPIRVDAFYAPSGRLATDDYWQGTVYHNPTVNGNQLRTKSLTITYTNGSPVLLLVLTTDVYNPFAPSYIAGLMGGPDKILGTSDDMEIQPIPIGPAFGSSIVTNYPTGAYDAVSGSPILYLMLVKNNNLAAYHFC